MDTKVCTGCKMELPLTTEFFQRETRDKSGFRSRCKTCVNSYKRDQGHYREKKKQFVYSLKNSCVICDEPDPVVIDFHHIDPETKLFTIGSSLNRSKEAIKTEAEKCVCLCANCDRRVHAGTVEIPTQT